MSHKQWFEVKTTDYPLRKIVARTETTQTYYIRVTLECGHVYGYTRAANTPDTKKAVRCRACQAEADKQ